MGGPNDQPLPLHLIQFAAAEVFIVEPGAKLESCAVNVGNQPQCAHERFPCPPVRRQALAALLILIARCLSRGPMPKIRGIGPSAAVPAT